MWQPTSDIIAEIVEHAGRRAPLEACGVIIDNGVVVEVENTATDKHAFVMDARQYADAIRGRTLQAIWHSHVYLPPKPSEGDRTMCERGGVPWLIVSYPTAAYEVIEPCGYLAPLVGRTWCWGAHDCYALVRDAHRQLGGHELRDYPREWLWWEHGQNILVDQFDDAGFVCLPQGTDPKTLDVMLIQIRGAVPNHCGVYLDEMGGVLLHHLMDRPSMRERYAGFYHRHTTHHLRHRSRL